MNTNKRVDISYSMNNISPMKEDGSEHIINKYTLSLNRNHLVLELQTIDNSYLRTEFVRDTIHLIEIENNIVVITTKNEIRIYFHLLSVQDALECMDYLIDRLYQLQL